MSKKILFVVLSFFLLFAACNNMLTGGSTETSSKVASMLFNPGGTPAAYAMVHFYPRDYNPQTGLAKTTMAATVDSTTTDANGNYAIILNTGAYTILANSDSGLAYQDSIPAKGGATIHPPACTLKTPGTLHGVVQLQPGDDARTVFILFLGTHSYTTPDDAAGNFTTEPMAGGKYRVRILTTLPDYQVMDTSFTIKAGTNSVLPDTIRLKYTGIPTPKDLKVSFDTLHQTVDLSWAMPDTSLLSGYNVYRSIKGQNFSLVTQTPLPKTQTVYYDTGLTVGTVYEYRVVSRTQAGIESKMVDIVADTALVVSSALVTTTFSWSSVNIINDTASINDTVKVIVNYSNPTRKIDSVEWYLDTAQLPRRTKIDSSLSGKDSLTYYCPAQAGMRQLIVKAVDAGNTTWRDTFKLWVIQDAPKANAGNDMTVSINDTVRLHGSATQQFGTIVKWEWDIGNTGTFKVTSSGDTTFKAPSVENLNYFCVLRVTDDDGNIVTDTMNVAVLPMLSDSAGLYNNPPTDNSQACLATKFFMYWRIFDSLEVAILGSSQANYGINPAMITGLEALNMAAPSADLLAQKNIILNYLLRHSSRIKVICSSLDIGWLQNPDGNLTWESGLGQSIGYKYDSSRAFWLSGVPGGFKNLITQVSIPNPNDTLNMGFVAMPSMGWGVNPPPFNAALTSWTITDANYQKNLATITMVADSMRSRGVHWIMVNFPMSPYYKNTDSYGPYGPSWQTAHNILQQLRAIEVSNQFFHFYDANADGNHDYTDADAYESDLLCGTGADKLTTRLDTLIDSILVK
jgi:hypothetical protein